MHDDFKQLIEQVKLRNPIEDVVRERVPTLRKAGALWVACCPFHEEKTPSFKVDPRRGTWRCFGACGVGGDQLSFLQRACNVEFSEALEILATRAGVALPDRRSGARGDANEYQALYEILARAQEFYRRMLRSPEGSAALAYVRERGLSDATLDAFGIGYAPARSDTLVSKAGRQSLPLEPLIAAGLARRDPSGRAYDFFHDRLMFPVRDLKGRTVGFGGRRLKDGDARVPKYVNTSETALFRKGQLIYALDLALEHVRRASHLVLVEGYTDVMAAHQVGLRTVAAVLGTATTDEHALLVRRTGARRVSLVFDGDEAGRKATFKALHGLLPLEIEIDVVRLASEDDPCDLLVREGAAPFERALADAQGWFAFLLEGLDPLSPAERLRAVDRILELVLRLAKPLAREQRLDELALALGVPSASVRAQFASLPERLREERDRAARARSDAPKGDAPKGDGSNRGVSVAQRDSLRRAYGELAGAALLEPALTPRLAPWAPLCSEPDLRRVLEALLEVHARRGDAASVDQVMTALEGDAARDLVVPLVDDAASAESPSVLLEGALRFLGRTEELHRIEELARLAPDGDDETARLKELHQLHRGRLQASAAQRTAR